MTAGPSGLTPGVIVLENPYVDPVTVAYSALDAAKARLYDGAGELDRLSVKLAKAQADVDAVLAAVAEAVNSAALRQQDVEQAQSDLDAAKAAHTDLADGVTARHEAAHQQQMTELAGRLAQLKES